jgi:hypothetical protein
MSSPSLVVSHTAASPQHRQARVDIAKQPAGVASVAAAAEAQQEKHRLSGTVTAVPGWQQQQQQHSGQPTSPSSSGTQDKGSRAQHASQQQGAPMSPDVRGRVDVHSLAFIKRSGSPKARHGAAINAFGPRRLVSSASSIGQSAGGSPQGSYKVSRRRQAEDSKTTQHASAGGGSPAQTLGHSASISSVQAHDVQQLGSNADINADITLPFSAMTVVTRLPTSNSSSPIVINGSPSITSHNSNTQPSASGVQLSMNRSQLRNAESLHKKLTNGMQ